MHSSTRAGLTKIAFALIASMSAKFLIIGSSFFLILLNLVSAYVLFFLQPQPPVSCNSNIRSRGTTLSFASVPKVVCVLSPPRVANGDDYRPSLEPFLQESKADADQDLRLSGLAVVSKLTNVRQPLVDVSKSRIHVDKIALVTLKNDTADFSCGDLALNAQNAGYSVVTYFGYGNCGPDGNVSKPHTQEEILIPIVFVRQWFNCTRFEYNDNYDFLKATDKTFVNIIETQQGSDELSKMAEYLKRLYYWFLLGPIITLVWLRRKKKLCCMTISHQIDEESAAGNEENARLVPRVDEDQEQNIQDITGEEIESELQPLINTIYTDTDITTFDHMGRIIVCVTRLFGRSIRYLAVGLGYVLLTLVALPVGISRGGLSFFRFDEQKIRIRTNTNYEKYERYSDVLPLWWPSIQIFCFFMYSRFNCASAWTVLTNVSKLIRSHWFHPTYICSFCASLYRIVLSAKDSSLTGLRLTSFYILRFTM